jgi:hypothetical protein
LNTSVRIRTTTLDAALSAVFLFFVAGGVDAQLRTKPSGNVVQPTPPNPAVDVRNPAAKASPPAAPIRLVSTADPKVCFDHTSGNVLGGALFCEELVKLGSPILVWDWKARADAPRIDGFRIYEVPDPTIRTDPRTGLVTAPKSGSVIAGAKPQGKLIDTQADPGWTMRALARRPGGHDGRCFAVAAHYGSLESDYSDIVCIRADEQCRLDPEVETRKRTYQLDSIEDKTARSIDKATGKTKPVEAARALAHLAQQRFPWSAEPAGWPADRRAQWWRERLGLDDDAMVQLKNDADMGANVRIRLLYLHFDDPNLPSEVRAKLEEAFLKFRYWINEPKGAGETNHVKGMNLWSENHQILYASVEYLAGQYFADRCADAVKCLEVSVNSNVLQMSPDAAAKFVQPYQRLNPDGTTATTRAARGPRELSRVRFEDGMTGREHMAAARTRIVRWLDERFRFGFSEWNAPNYLEYDLLALINLVDFAEDKEIRTRAAVVLDLLVYDFARFNQHGSFGVTAGRAHSYHKMSGWQQGVGDAIEILFGARTNCTSARPLDARGCFVEPDQASAHALASSRRYCLPRVLKAIGREKDGHWVERYRTSIDFDEGPREGIGFSSFDDAVSWWGRGAFLSKQVTKLTQRMMEQYRLQESDPFPTLLKPPQRAALGIEEVADWVSVQTEGLVLTRANIEVYRNPDVMLSSAQNRKPGQAGFQTNPWQATFDANATVFTTFPTAAESKEDSGSWWTGNAVNPMVIQFENAAIISYDMRLLSLAHFRHEARTHAWFPKYAFDETDVRAPKGCDCKFEGHQIPKQTVIGAAKGAAVGCLVKGVFGLFTGGPVGAAQGCAAAAGGSALTGGAMDTVHETAESVGRLASGECDCSRGRWFFARKGKGYIGLYSAQPCVWNRDEDPPANVAKNLIVQKSGDLQNEIRCDGHKRNIWIAQVGNEAQFGSFAAFKDRVANARIHLNGLNWEPADLHCSYDVPDGRRLVLTYGGADKRIGVAGDLRLDGPELYENRFDGPYAQAKWGEKQYTIRHRNLELTLSARDAKTWLRYGDGVTR